MHLVIDRGGPGRTVQKIYVADANNNMIGQPVTYNVDPTSLDLLGVTDRTNNTTQFQYLDPAHPHFLTGATDALGVAVVTAAYNAQGQLASLANALNDKASIGNGGFNGSDAAEGVTDPAGNSTQSIYDQNGDVTRQIQTVKDAAGNVTGYLVSVTDYAYASSDVTHDLSNIFQGNDLGGNVQPGFANGNSLESVSKYQSFFVPGADLSGLRYSQRPTVRTQYTAYDFAGNVTEQKSYLSTTPDGLESLYGVVTYGGYVLGKPQSTTQSLEADDAHTGATLSSRAVSQTSAAYDPHTGLLRSTIDPGGVETDYTYTAAGGGVPAGLLLTETRKSSSSGAALPVVANVYYTATDVADHVPGAVAGLLRYSVSGAATLDVAHQLTSDTAGQETYYAYDAAGDVVLQYAFKAWTNPDGTTSRGWVGTTTAYDAAQRATATSQGVYLYGGATDPDTGDPVPDLTADAAAGLPAFDTTKDAAFAGFNNGSPLPGGSTTYTPDGKVDTTTDPYGGVTRNTYDANGNLIRTLYPDSTETRSVYDAMNRVTWQTDRYKTTTTYANGAFADDNATAAPATETVYDSLGRVSSTERHSGVLVTIGSTTLGAAAVATSAAAATGTAFSTQRTFYDDQGRTIETVDASGLRTGTVYYPDGRAQFAGPLTPAAPDGGRSGGYTTSDFASFTQYRYDQFDPQGNRYDEVIDANGHRTDTYQDGLGRVTRTVYDDGSFAETLYGVGDQPVTRSDLTPPTTAEGWIGIQPGGSETVSIAQRKSGDPVLATYSVYDAAGRLTDVWEPAVLDADPASPTYNRTLRPHWHYAYDAAGNQTTQQDAKGRVTTFAYDENGNQVSRTLPDGEKEASTYNAYGQVATHTDFDGNTATDTYYPAGDVHAGMPEQVVYAGAAGSGKATQIVSYTYDALGRALTTADASGTTTDHYDGQGNLVEADTPEGTIHYAFDPATGRHTETYTDNSDTAYDYDSQGRLWHVTVKKLNGQVLTTPQVTTYTYDAAGNKQTETLPDGEVTTYGYDDLNRLTGVVEVQGATTLFSQNYILNDDGTRKHVDETQRQPDGSTVASHTDWTYDADGRLQTEAVTSTAAGQSYTDAFAYDLANNRVSKAHTGPGGGTSESIAYTYNGDDQLTKQVSSLSGETDDGYDADGSLTTSTHGGHETEYAYDARNKLVGVSADHVTQATYIYDEAGNRVRETAGGTTTYYLTDTRNPTGYAQPLEERSAPAAAPTKTYAIGDRVLGQSDAAGAVSYLLADGHNSTRLLTDASGAVTRVFAYDAFGGAINFDASSPGTVFLFGGDAVYDPISGLYMHGDGTRDRLGFAFIQADGQGNGTNADPISLNTYLYANADPASFADPSGHEGLADVLTVAAINAFALGFGVTILTNSLATAHAYNHPVQGSAVDPGGKWLAMADGISFGYGLGSAGVALQSYKALGSDAIVSGVSLGFSISLPGIKTIGSYLKDLAWYARLLTSELSVPGQPIAASRDLVAGCLRGWARQAGGDIRMNVGYSLSLNFGGGIVFGAPTASFLPGLFVGVQGGGNANIGPLNFGASGDYLQGFSFHDGSFTTAGEADFGFSMGLGGGNGFGVQIAGTFFIPINMPEWYKYI